MLDNPFNKLFEIKCLDQVQKHTIKYKTSNYIAQVNCTWGPYGEWSDCTKSCGGGFRTRLRDVQQLPQNGGLECTGASTDLSVCNEHECPSKL